MKKAIIVVGFHRSGTSALTGVLDALGAYSGNDLIPPSEENEKGFFENMRVYRANEYILENYFGVKWNDIDGFKKIKSNREIEAILKFVLKETFGNSKVIVVKDPRICLMLPLYKKVLSELGYKCYVIGTKRDSESIVKSVSFRYGVAPKKAISLIDEYAKIVKTSSEAFPVVEFKCLLESPDLALKGIKKHLPFLNYSAENIEKVKQFVSPSLQHFSDVKVDLYIKTYINDFQWLFYCLKSVEKFATNYNKLIIIVPEGQHNEFQEQVGKHFSHSNWECHIVKEDSNGYLFQQYMKMSAHKYSNAEFIKFLDSDCIFTRPFDATSLITAGRPQYLYRPYYKKDGSSNVGEATCWKVPTETVLKRKVECEFMCRHLFCYRRDTLGNFEKWFHKNHQKGLLDHILSAGTFSEFNALGAFAFYHEREKYDFVSTDGEWKYVEPQVKQYHSYTEFEKAQPEIKKLLEI